MASSMETNSNPNLQELRDTVDRLASLWSTSSSSSACTLTD